MPCLCCSHLARNPFICDCNLRWLSEYLQTHPIETSGARCDSPRRMQRKKIGLVKDDKFRCKGTCSVWVFSCDFTPNCFVLRMTWSVACAVRWSVVYRQHLAIELHSYVQQVMSRWCISKEFFPIFFFRDLLMGTELTEYDSYSSCVARGRIFFTV